MKECDLLTQEECRLEKEDPQPELKQAEDSGMKIGGADATLSDSSGIQSVHTQTESRDPPVSDAEGGRQNLSQKSNQMGEVRLLQTVRIPAGYKKIVRGQVQGGEGGTLTLFTSTIDHPDVLLADSAVCSMDDGCTTLILENHGTEKLLLERGTVLGTVTPVDEVTFGGQMSMEVMDTSISTDQTDANCGNGVQADPYLLATEHRSTGRGAHSLTNADPPSGGAMAHSLIPAGDRSEERERTSDVIPVSTPDGGRTAMHLVSTSVLSGGQYPDDGVTISDAQSEEGTVGRFESGSEGRIKRLLEQLDLGSGHLTAPQEEQLVTLLRSFVDVFALDSSELGSTSLIHHSIDTGDHPPIRQPVRRMPFALRPQVDQLVQDACRGSYPAIIESLGQSRSTGPEERRINAILHGLSPSEQSY